jgi:hypothetical protein
MVRLVSCGIRECKRAVIYQERKRNRERERERETITN